MGRRKLVVYVDIAVVAIFDFISGRLELVEMVNMVLLRAKTLTHLKKMPVPQAMGGGEGWVMAILYCKSSFQQRGKKTYSLFTIMTFTTYLVILNIFICLKS